MGKPVAQKEEKEFKHIIDDRYIQQLQLRVPFGSSVGRGTQNKEHV